MADTFTNFWALTKPEIGASRDSWGTKLNSDLDALDALLAALQPIGAMTDFAGWYAPYGWVLCDGTVYLIATYPRLFAVISNAYGGDGVTTFAVPDLRARYTVGAGSTTGDQSFTWSIYVGEIVGDFAIPLSIANLPAALISTSPSAPHNHPGSVSDFMGPHSHSGSTDTGGSHVHGLPPQVNWHSGGQDAAGGFDNAIAFGQNTNYGGDHTHTFNTNYAGSHQHNLAVSNDGVHTHTFSLGAGNAVRIVPPSFGTTKIICTGPPTMQAQQSAAQPLLLASPLRGVH